ncbi:MAG: amidohydrolase family protein [Pirellulales bacterium]
MIDVNVYLHRWPFRRLSADEPETLVAKLCAAGVTQAWCGSFEALLHRDVAGVNSRLTSDCRKFGSGLLEPFGTIHPLLPDWQDDVRRCQETHGMRGIRLHPNYHGYKLDDSACGELLALAAERKMVVQIVATMEDERTQHPLVQVPHVDPTPLIKLLEQHAGLQIVLLNAFRGAKVDVVDKLASTGRCWFDIATREGVAGVEGLVRQVGHERVLFGSHAPLFIHESAVLKLKESPLAGVQLEAVTRGNAEELWKS